MEELRERLIGQLWEIGRMDIMEYVAEFNGGETALLWFLCRAGEANPSVISDNMNLSRARVAKILASLRKKKFVTMDISDEDRRKMTVRLTEEGKAVANAKYAYLQNYLDGYLNALGGEDAAALVALLDKILACSARCLKP